MIAISELLSADALRRYDDTGDPVYTTFERVLVTLRWFDWCSAERMLDALGVDDDLERARYVRALAYHLQMGRLERRGQHAATEYRLITPSRWQPKPECRRNGCHEPPAPGRVLCVTHGEWQRQNKRARRAA